MNVSLSTLLMRFVTCTWKLATSSNLIHDHWECGWQNSDSKLSGDSSTVLLMGTAKYLEKRDCQLFSQNHRVLDSRSVHLTISAEIRLGCRFNNGVGSKQIRQLALVFQQIEFAI